MKIIKKHIISFFIASFIASISYLGGVMFNSSFNLKEWTEGSRVLVSIGSSIICVGMYLIIFFNFEDFTHEN